MGPARFQETQPSARRAKQSGHAAAPARKRSRPSPATSAARPQRRRQDRRPAPSAGPTPARTRGPRARLDPPADGDPRRRIGRLETDFDNLRAAFQWSLELSDSETALRLASSLQPLWLGRCRMLEGLAWFDAALAGQPAGAEPVAPEVRVRALADAVVLDAYTATPRRLAKAEEAVARARPLGDPALLGRALFAAGCAAGYVGADGRPYLEEAIMLAREAGDTRTLAGSLARQAFVERRLRRPGRRAIGSRRGTCPGRAGWQRPHRTELQDLAERCSDRARRASSGEIHTHRPYLRSRSGAGGPVEAVRRGLAWPRACAHGTAR